MIKLEGSIMEKVNKICCKELSVSDYVKEDIKENLEFFNNGKSFKNNDTIWHQMTCDNFIKNREIMF